MSSPTTGPQSLAQASNHRRAGRRIYLAFAPWALFTLVTQHDSLTTAAGLALAAAVAISIPSVLKGRPKMLELSAVIAFAAFTAVGCTADPATAEWVARYARAIAAGGLALTAFGSLLFVPFTEQYARESVPAQWWATESFRCLNRRLTTMWAWVFIAIVPSHLIAGAVDTHQADVIFNWVIPTVLIVWAAKRTAAVSDSPNQASRR